MSLLNWLSSQPLPIIIIIIGLFFIGALFFDEYFTFKPRKETRNIAGYVGFFLLALGTVSLLLNSTNVLKIPFNKESDPLKHSNNQNDTLSDTSENSKNTTKTNFTTSDTINDPNLLIHKERKKTSPPPKKIEPPIIKPYKLNNNSFFGFSAGVLSYGSYRAKNIRSNIEAYIYNYFGFSELRENHLADSCRGKTFVLHIDANENKAPQGFSDRSAIIYYAGINKKKAEALAKHLSKRYEHHFDYFRGGGMCIDTNWYKKTIIIHIREKGF